MQRLSVRVVLVAALALAPSGAKAQVPDLPVGRWEGRAEVRSPGAPNGIEVSIEIAADSSVRGTAGGATLRNGRIIRNPSLPARFLGLGTTWVIEADLDGELVTGQLKRERVRMPISLGGEGLWGDFNAGRGSQLVSVRLSLSRAG
ncbi:MAG: hypothetical protein KF689_11575 [Gemmatimonadaceae bacterium]|nr:hypothetical protein [Gemmatimonadaceae bacterium]MCW5825763.1 hypothetical protein [Gemmatimonadaceae bacterium]